MKITQDQMNLLLKHFYSLWLTLGTEGKDLVLADLNDAIRDLFDNAKCNDFMFGFSKYDCHIVENRFNKSMKVQYYRRFKPKYKPKQDNPWKLHYSHEIEFDKFCFENCNPNIIHIIEKVLFQRI